MFLVKEWCNGVGFIYRVYRNPMGLQIYMIIAHFVFFILKYMHFFFSFFFFIKKTKMVDSLSLDLSLSLSLSLSLFVWLGHLYLAGLTYIVMKHWNLTRKDSQVFINGLGEIIVEQYFLNLFNFPRKKKRRRSNYLIIAHKCISIHYSTQI